VKSVQRKSVAVGGPLDKVVITAGSDWPGTIKSDPTGHYAWNQLRESWVWKRGSRRTFENFIHEVEPVRPGRKPRMSSRRENEE
jgi:hypothetical protein